MSNVFERLKRLRDAIAHRIARKLHFGEVAAHLGYLTFVFIEAHGTYALMAGVLGVVVVLTSIFGGGGD